MPRIKAPGASPGTAGTNATPPATTNCAEHGQPEYRNRQHRLAGGYPTGTPRRSPPARAGGFYAEQSPSSRWGLLCRTVPQLALGASMPNRIGFPTDAHSPRIKAPGASPGTAGTNATPPATANCGDPAGDVPGAGWGLAGRWHTETDPTEDSGQPCRRRPIHPTMVGCCRRSAHEDPAIHDCRNSFQSCLPSPS